MRLFELDSDYNTIYFTYVMANPPSYGYKLVYDKLKSITSNESEYIVYINPTQNSDYPLYFDETLKYNKIIFPDITFSEDNNIQNPFQALKKLSKEYSKIYFLTTDENVKNLNRMYDYAKQWGIVTFEMIGLGDSKTILPEGKHRSDAVDYAKNNDFESFCDAIPTKNNKILSQLFLDIRKRLIDKKDNKSKNDDLTECSKVTYDILSTLFDYNKGVLYENHNRDKLNNKTLDIGKFIDNLNDLKIVFSPKHNGISVGLEESTKKYVLILNTEMNDMKQFLDINETRVINALKKYHELNETVTSGNIAAVSSILGVPMMKRVNSDTVDLDFLKDIKYSNQSYKNIKCINKFLNKHNYIDSNIISKIQENLDE